MSTNVIQFQPQNQLPAAIAQALQQHGGVLSDALTDGVGASYANVSFKGKVFRIKYNGQETMLTDPNNPQMALQYLDVVILDAKGPLSKTFYASGYTEGATEQPDCASEDGLTPFAPIGKQVQCNDCRLCQWNVFGSKQSQDGKGGGGKACADTRKLAVVPAGDIENAHFGGPMLLRVPADSLKNLAQFSNLVKSQGAPFYAVIVRITFDMYAPHPKLVFTPLRYLDDREAQMVLGMQAHPTTKEIVQVNTSPVAALPAPVQQIPGQVPSQLQQAPTTQTPVVNSAPTTVPAPVAQPQYQPPQQQQQQPVQQPVVQQPIQTHSFGQPTPQPVQQPAQAAPPIPQTGQPYQPPQPVQYQPPQVQPVQQPQPVQYQQPTNLQPPPIPQQPQQYQPPQPQQPQQYAPQPVQQPPAQQAYAQQPQQPVPQQAPAQQPLQGGAGPMSAAVLSTVDALLG